MLVLDPFNGIVLANILSIVIGAIVLSRTYRDTAWRTAGRLLLGMVLGIPLGALLVYTLDPQHLLIAVGSLTIFAVVLALFRHPMPFLAHRSGAFIAGSVSAFSNLTAGVGGPALAVYGAATRMPMQSFIPTTQVIVIVMNIVSVAVKSPFTIPLPLLLGSFGCVLLGLAVGSLLRRWIPAHRAQVLALCIALFGAGVATLRGIIEVMG